jgi:excinuclease ABC subunit C
LENLKIQNKVTLIGIAKRLEEIYKPHDPVPLFLDKSSETLRIIQHMRNEAHRFAITFHRNVRSKKFIESSLDKIPGIGEKTIEQLMQHFGSMNNIKKADQNQLEKMIGRHKAIKIFNYFRNKSEN